MENMGSRKIDYNNKWRDKNYKRIEFIVPLSEEAVLKKLDEQENRASYLVNLVKEDIKKKGN